MFLLQSYMERNMRPAIEGTDESSAVVSNICRPLARLEVFCGSYSVDTGTARRIGGWAICRSFASCAIAVARMAHAGLRSGHIV